MRMACAAEEGLAVRFNIFLYGDDNRKKIVSVEASSAEEARKRVAKIRGIHYDDLKAERVRERMLAACPKCGFRRSVEKPFDFMGKKTEKELLAEFKPPICGACHADERASYYLAVAAEWREKARRRRNSQNAQRGSDV